MPVYAYGLGTSTISLNTTSISIVQGQSTTISYKVNLSTGSTWGTVVNISNAKSLLSDGISISLSTGMQDPPFSGTATIKVNSSAAIRTYNATFVASGDDPTTTPTMLTIIINGKNVTAVSPSKNSTKTNNTTTISTINTTSTEKTTTNANPGGVLKAQNNSYITTNQNNTGNSEPEYISIFAVIILFAVIIIRLRML